MSTLANKRIINAVKMAFEDMEAVGVVWRTPKKEAMEAIAVEIFTLKNADELLSFEVALRVYKKASMPTLIDNCLWACLEAKGVVK